MTESIHEKEKVWIFQINPRAYDIEKAIGDLKILDWAIRRKYKHEVKINDTVYIWQSGPRAGVLAVARVISEPEFRTFDRHEKQYVLKKERFEGKQFFVKVEITEVLDERVSRTDLAEDPVLSKSLIITSPQGTNALLTEEQSKKLRDLVYIDAISRKASKEEALPFTKEHALKDLFISEEEFDLISSVLKDRKNIILQGPPGAGKTFIAKRLAYYLIGRKDNSRGAMVQFHKSYSYEDFIQGLRPDKDGRVCMRNGIFYDFCLKAPRRRQPGANHYRSPEKDQNRLRSSLGKTNQKN